MIAFGKEKGLMRWCAVRVLGVAWLLGLGAAAAAAEKDVTKLPVIVVLDFDSPQDDGATGRAAAANFRAKITRYRLFVTIEDMDREEIEKRTGFRATFDTDPKKILELASGSFHADLVMWGKVEPAGGELLRLSVRVLDCAAGPDKLRFESAVTVPNRYALQLGVFQILGELTGRKDPRYAPLPPDAEERWAKAPNLLGAEGFETGRDHPDGWEPFGAVTQMKEVHWEKNPDGTGRCIVMRMSEAVAGMEGDYYFSEFFDIEPGAIYRIAFRVKTMAPTCKIFVKYYMWFKDPHEKEGQWREVGRTQINCRTKSGQWVADQRECHPQIYLTRAKQLFTPRKCRIGLYAYWPAGVVYWDDVVFKKIGDPPKDLRPYEVGEVGRRPFERPE